MEVKIAQADIPTLNGNMYPKDELEKAIGKSGTLLVTLGTNPEDFFEGLKLEDVVGKVQELSISDNGTVTGEMTVLNTPKAEILNEIDKHSYYNPVFTGTVSIENGVKVIRDITMRYISVDSTSAIVFAEEK